MARIARVVAEHYPYHITQRGNRRQDTFFCEEDYRVYQRLMAEWCYRCGVEIWAYYLIAVPGSEEGLRRAMGEESSHST